jgi:hypothetical protein|tara:strand:- start:106 stop:264 length:159 start_codon:yes stop_codon:yes gene_type:complete
MSKDNQRTIDSLEEEYTEPTESIASEKSSSRSSEQNSDSGAPNLEDIRTAGL